MGLRDERRVDTSGRVCVHGAVLVDVIRRSAECGKKVCEMHQQASSRLPVLGGDVSFTVFRYFLAGFCND